jgi:hypothetical protein
VVSLPTEFAYSVQTFAGDYRLTKLIHEYSFTAVFAATKDGPAAFLCIPQTQKILKIYFDFLVFLP